MTSVAAIFAVERKEVLAEKNCSKTAKLKIKIEKLSSVKVRFCLNISEEAKTNKPNIINW